MKIIRGSKWVWIGVEQNMHVLGFRCGTQHLSQNAQSKVVKYIGAFKN